jgi:exopolyphosphatase/guanosine-5'-triphosphate,3'-diphosphate pyrophosphatase
MSRLLVLDYGSNSLRWLVVDRAESGAPLGPVESGGRSTGLGRPGEDGRVSPEAVKSTLAATEEAVARGRELGVERAVAVATHFARELGGVETLVGALKSRWGVELVLLSGTEEAWLTRVGVEEGLRCLGLDGRAFCRGHYSLRSFLAVDVGGGSTELSWWGGRELFTRSLPLGAIGLTSRHLVGDPPTLGEMDGLRRDVRDALEGLPADTLGLPVVASGGTATALAVVSLGLGEYLPLVVQGTPLRRDDLQTLIGRLAGVTLAGRRRLLPADEERAGIIVAGALVLETLLEHLGADGLLVSDYDLKHGAAIAYGDDKPGLHTIER